MLIYVSGRYRGKDRFEILEHIQYAEKFAIKIWEMGHIAICPHLNTRFFEEKCAMPDEHYIEGDLVIIERCDALLMIPNWQDSEGAKIEHDYAKKIGKVVYYDLKEIPCPA